MPARSWQPITSTARQPPIGGASPRSRFRSRRGTEQADAPMTLQPADVAIDYNAMADDVFRDEIRSWVAENCPSDLRFPPYRLHHALTRRWYEKLAAKGWLAPAWPRAWGGLGLTPMKSVIMSEEVEQHRCGPHAEQAAPIC